jgi:hypothetical protein
MRNKYLVQGSSNRSKKWISLWNETLLLFLLFLLLMEKNYTFPSFPREVWNNFLVVWTNKNDDFGSHQLRNQEGSNCFQKEKTLLGGTTFKMLDRKKKNKQYNSGFVKGFEAM